MTKQDYQNLQQILKEYTVEVSHKISESVTIELLITYPELPSYEELFNEQLQEGDYVENLTEEQFNKLKEISFCFLNYTTSVTGYDGFISKSVIYDDGRIAHTQKSKIKNLLTFDQFKQRAINTFRR